LGGERSEDEKKYRRRKNMKKGIAIGIMAVLAIMMLALTGCQPNTIIVDGSGVDTEKVNNAGGCSVSPSIVLSAVDAENPNTAVTVTSSYIVNGKYKSTYTAPALGDKVSIVANASSWIDAETETRTIVCGPNNFDVELYDYAAPTVAILQRATTLTDNAAGGASNSTAVAVGGSETYTLEITPASKDATGDLIFIVELSTTTNASSVTLSDAFGSEVAKVTTPSTYSTTLTSPKVQAFEIKNMVGAAKRVFSLTVEAKAAKDINGAVYTTALVEQSFVDTDGTVGYGVEDSDGTDVSEGTFDYDFFITQ